MNQREVGTSYEQKAGVFLTKKGYQVLEYNYRCRIGEIDIIAKDGAYLVFVEVKYRKNAKKGYPIEAVGLRKQQKISMVASYYCMQKGMWDTVPCRFDVVAILGEEITLLQNAFEYQQ